MVALSGPLYACCSGPLHFAADLRDARAVAELLAAKADPDARPPGVKLSPLDIAFEVDEVRSL